MAAMDEKLLHSLREVFQAVATMKPLWNGRLNCRHGQLARMAFVVRDARLELNRLSYHELSDAERKTLDDFSGRLEETAAGRLSPQPLPGKAKEALAAFGWAASEEDAPAN